jgi:hypothetical protein
MLLFQTRWEATLFPHPGKPSQLCVPQGLGQRNLSPYPAIDRHRCLVAKIEFLQQQRIGVSFGGCRVTPIVEFCLDSGGSAMI